MSSARSFITNIREYERFLRAKGFSRKEAAILAKPFKNIQPQQANLMKV